MIPEEYTIRNARPNEFDEVGKLMVRVYSQLEGFPKESDQPKYYSMLANVAALTQNPEVELLVAITISGEIAGAVVFFGDMKYYGSGGAAIAEKNAAGFRLLAVSEKARGQGVGRLLTKACIQRARNNMCAQIIIHTTRAMQPAWNMYENIGFKRSPELDFAQGNLMVFGFRLLL